MSDVLDLFDQAIFLAERATGITDIVQCVWVYDRAIDIDGLQRFHAHLQRGRLSRLVERSPVPFGRPRWVASDRTPDMEIAAVARSRDEFDDWLADQANTRIDAEHGPGWHLGVLRFTDGGTGISLVVSHSLTDGALLNEALAAAACGRHDTIAWPARRSRRWWRAVGADVWQTVCDLPDIGRSAIALVRRARAAGGNSGTAIRPAAVPATGLDERITIPTATIFVDEQAWDARAKALGGSGNALLVGLAAHLAERVGRVAADGTVELTMPVNERTGEDTRANAVLHLTFAVDPAPVATDLREIRATIKRALLGRDEIPDGRRALLPIVPLLPQVIFRRLVGMAAASPIGVNSSNLGVIPSDATRPDGTQADNFAITTAYPGMTTTTMYRIGGRLQLHSGRANGRIFVTVLAYEPGELNSAEVLRQTLRRALNTFALDCSGWGGEALGRRSFEPVHT